MRPRRGLTPLAVLVISIVLLLRLSAQAGSGPGQPRTSEGRAAYARALQLEAQGNHSGALALLWSASGLAPHDADIQNALGDALARLGALDAAIDAYRHALAEDPRLRTAANNLILTLVKAGRGEEAVARARALVDEGPQDPDRWFTLGLAQSEQDVEAATATFHRVLQLAPRHTLARYNLALVLKRADRLSEAIDTLQQALDTDPRPEAFYTLGVIYWQQGNTDGALRALRQAVAADARYADAYHTLGTVRAARKEWPAATEALRRAIALRPELPAVHDTLARVLQQAGDTTGSTVEFEEANRLRRRAAVEQEAAVWTAVGSRTLTTGNLSAALDQFRRATAVFDDYAPAHYQIGLVLRRLGQAEASRVAFARAAQLNPGLVPPRPDR
jgi:tetratricopeptide (TPR) repeat protein